MRGIIVNVLSGTLNGDMTYVCTSSGLIADDQVIFDRQSALGQITIGRGLVGGHSGIVDSNLDDPSLRTIQIGTHAITGGAAKDNTPGQMDTSMIATETITNLNISTAANIEMSKIKDLQSTLDNMLNGISWRQPVRLASVENIIHFNSSVSQPYPIPTFDGMIATSGDRILLKEQTDPIENGIYDFIETDTDIWVLTRTNDFGGEDCDAVNDGSNFQLSNNIGGVDVFHGMR
jgi:hypothetical protein